MAAAALPPFIQQFEMAINNLGAITEANVKDNIARRTQFTTNVLAGLTDINTQVQSLIRRLTRFRQRYEQLINNQGRYDVQINALTQRAEELEKQINELAAKNGSSSAAAQQQLAQCEAQRAQLQTAVDALQKNNAQLTQELQALREQIAKLIGQQPAQDQELMQQLEQQIQKLNDQITANNNRIAELEGLNQQLEQKLKISQGASAAAQEANQKIIDGHQGNIDTLEKQIAELTAARDDLQNRIVRATPILQQIYGYINDLINAPPHAGQVTQFNETLDEIRKSLQALNNLIPPQFNDDPLGPPGSPGSSGASGLGAALGLGSSSASGLSGALGLGSLSGEPSSPSAASDLPGFGSDSNSVVSEPSPEIVKFST
jgi:chromosome segregation ATPase